MARFFIDRPVFAWVVSLLILLFGCLAITKLAVEQYPDLAPPSISVSGSYAGASAETIQNTVTSIIEQQLNGIDHLLYMTSSSNSSGEATITLYFQPGTNADTAQVQVQNKVQLAMPSLPETVQKQGLTVTKAATNMVLIVSLSSEDGSMNEFEVGNYIASSVLDPVRRISGVGDVSLFGTEQAMRIWLNPQKLNSFNLMPGDVTDAIRAQNTNVAVGQVGSLPAAPGQELNITLQGRTTLATTEQFGNILLRVNTDGSRVLLRDVARIELGGQDYSTKTRAKGKPAAAMGIKLAPGANALSTVSAVKAKIDEMAEFFPHGLVVGYPVDTSTFVRISIEEVVKTLIEAVILVFLVMYLFLQNIRATLIPTIVVPMALMGTFACMYVFGYSINVLTMFGMVLAIGILIDDAIVVVESVERIMAEEGLSPRDATRKAMGQITGALIGITVVLVAVFVPMAFFSGSVGAIYRQFSLALVSSMLFSVFLAMSLTPALCATLLKPINPAHARRRGFFGWFNRVFAAGTTKYQGVVARMLAKPFRYMVIYLMLTGLVVWLYARLPTSFLPDEDQGMFITSISLPVGATQERTLEVIKQVEDYLRQQPEVDDFLAIAGFSFNGNGQSGAMCFATLKDWNQRKGSAHSVQAIVGRAGEFYATIKDAMVFAMNPPPIRELGNSSGFDLQLKDLGGLGHAKLVEARKQLLDLAAKAPGITGMRMQGMEDEAQINIEIDDTKASALGISIADINSALETSFGSAYVNNFVHGNRVQRVLVQMDAPYRMLPTDIDKVFVRNRTGKMVPLSTLAKLTWTYGSPQLQRYNGSPSVEIVGTSSFGGSTGDAMNAVEAMAKQLPEGIGYEWTGQSYEERLSSSQAPLLYSLSILVVFLCLAALYESWSIPLAVLLVIPLGILGAVLATELRGLSNDVYFKVGFLTIVGLSTKNAILIIEFAKDLQKEGKGLIEATLEAVHLRLRPILMTSFAFILGVLPLAISTGAGSGSQNAIGTGVIGGMLTATFLAIFLVPVFFVLVRRLIPAKKKLI